MKRSLWFFSAIASLLGAAAYCANDVSTVTEQGYGLAKEQLPGAYSSPARFDMSNEWGFFVNGSYLYWAAGEDGLDVAVNYPASIHAQSERAKVENMNFHYTSAYKAGAGVIFENHDDWLFNAEYTHFQTKEKYGATPMESGGSLSASWQSQDALTYAHGRWSLKYNMFDALFSRPYYLGRYLTVNPFCGFRGGWINQRYKAIYHTATHPIYPNARQKSWLAGARAGLNASWMVGGGFRFFADAAGSLLYQDFKVRYQATQSSSFIGAQQEAVHSNFTYVGPNAEAGMGIGWGSYFCSEGWHFDMTIGYDLQIYWSQNAMRALKDKFQGYLSYDHQNFPRGDLSLQGLTVTMRLDF